jgi:hypothetical protein
MQADLHLSLPLFQRDAVRVAPVRAARSMQLARRMAAAVAASCALSLAVAPALTYADEVPDTCAALAHVVSTRDFQTLRGQRGGMLTDAPFLGDCRAARHVYDCRFAAHWGADGVVSDPLEEMGADIAACFSNVVHDVNTPTRQHFTIRSDSGPVSVTASVDGPRTLHLRIVR